MFEQYAMSVAVALVTVMLVTLVLLATLLESLGRRYHAYDIVGLMGTTSVITTCLVGLFVLFLLYGPTGKNCKGDVRAAGSTAEYFSAGSLIHAVPGDEEKIDMEGRNQKERSGTSAENNERVESPKAEKSPGATVDFVFCSRCGHAIVATGPYVVCLQCGSRCCPSCGD